MARQRLHIALFVLIIVSTLTIGCLGASADTSFETEMLERMKSLEKQGQQQAETIQAMESRLENQERTISDYKQRVADLEETVANLQHKQGPNVADIDHYKQRMADLEQSQQTVAELQHTHDPETDEDQVTSNASSNRGAGITRHVQSGYSEDRPVYSKPSYRQKRALLNAEGPVAFHAVIKARDVDHLGLNQHVIFPAVMANLGGGYHNQHGIFIAPQPGIYIFSTTIMANNRANHPEISVHLMKNGQVLANAYARAETGRFDQGSVTVVTQLVAGDDVWVSVYGQGADTSTHGDYFDSFMGCLVFPL